MSARTPGRRPERRRARTEAADRDAQVRDVAVLLYEMQKPRREALSWQECCARIGQILESDPDLDREKLKDIIHILWSPLPQGGGAKEEGEGERAPGGAP